jgi:hypothetical protein
MTSELGKWSKTQRPTRADLVKAIRTLVSMASCWLDRDEDQRDGDVDQAELLDQVVQSLGDAAAAQRKHARKVLAVLYRDEVVNVLAKGSDVGWSADREQRFPHLPHEREVTWPATYWMFLDDDPLVTALRAGFFNYSSHTGGQPLVLPLERARHWAQEVRNLRAKKRGKVNAAGSVVLQVLHENHPDGKTDWSDSQGRASKFTEKSVDRRFARLLKDHRHKDSAQRGLDPEAEAAATAEADAEAAAKTAAKTGDSDGSPPLRTNHGGLLDLGEYFGALGREPDVVNPRSAAAWSLLAEVAANPSLAPVLAKRGGDTWADASRGVLIEPGHAPSGPGAAEVSATVPATPIGLLAPAQSTIPRD